MFSFKLRESFYVIFFKRFRTRFNRDLDDSIDDNNTRFKIQTNIRSFLFTL